MRNSYDKFIKTKKKHIIHVYIYLHIQCMYGDVYRENIDYLK